MARVLRMPDVADDPSSATLTAWLVGEYGDFVGAQSIATVETDTSLLSIEVAEPGFLVRSLVEPGDHVEPGSPLAVLGAPGEVIEDVEDLMVTLGLAIGSEAHDAGVHLRALPSDDPLYATTWPPHPPVAAVPSTEAEVTEVAEVAEVAEVDDGEPPEPETEVEESVDDTAPMLDQTALDQTTLDQTTSDESMLDQSMRDVAVLDEPTAHDEPAVVRRVVGWADSVAEAVLDAVGVVVERKVPAAAPTPRRPVAPPLPQVRLRDAVRADELLDIVARTDTVSLIALVVKAVAATSRQVPLRPGHAAITDVAVQRSTEAGPVFPVVHVANLMTASSLTTTLADLDLRAREGRIAGDLGPASVTVVDLGTEGVAEGTVDATADHPVVLTIGAVRVEPVVDGGVLVPGRVVAVTLACDANLVEPGVAARWLAWLAGLLEQPLRFLT